MAYFGSDEEEWAKVLSNTRLFDEVVDTFGVEPIDKYGSYKNISKELREKILKWLRRKLYYYLELLGAGEGNQDPEDIKLSEVYDMERRITNLEVLFAHLKERNERKGCGSSKVE